MKKPVLKHAQNAIAVMLLLGTAQATTVQALTFEEQIKKADVIVQVKILEVKTIQDKKYPWQQYTLQVQDTLKGDAKLLLQVGTVPSFQVLGGGDWQLEGAPTFQKNDEWVLFLYKAQYDSPIVGFNQGAYQLRDGRISNLGTLKLKDDQLATFKAAVREKL